jgi:hypothetical protein
LLHISRDNGKNTHAFPVAASTGPKEGIGSSLKNFRNNGGQSAVQVGRQKAGSTPHQRKNLSVRPAAKTTK